MFLASRWAARLSRQPIIPLWRGITTKSSGLPRKISRSGLPQNRHGAQPPASGALPPSGGDRVSSERHAEEQNKHLSLPTGPPSEQNNLVAPVHIPHDALSILPPDHPATSILANSTIVVQRNLELMNIMLGFEQANKYVIMDGAGNHIGYLAEPEGNMIKRQMFKTHRGFTVHVFDRHEKEVLRITRPFTLINSRIGVYDSHSADPSISLAGASAVAQVNSLKTEDMRIIGEVHQEWAPLRRKYNLFLNRPAEATTPETTPHLTAGDLPLSASTALQTQDASHRDVHMAQWASVNEPFLSWDFSLRSAHDQLLGSVNRDFRGLGRELLTDTGSYVLRMDSAALDAEPGHVISKTGVEVLERRAPGMTLDQRAVMLATAVSVDFDYFSRKSGSGGFMPMMPMWFPWGGAGAAEAGGAGGAVGAAEGAGGLSSEVGAAARGTTGVAGESAAAGAGSLAGYDAMQRGFGRGDDASPTADPYAEQASPGGDAAQTPQESFWGEDSPWDKQDGGSGDAPWTGGSQGGSGGDVGGGGGGGDGGGFSWGDFFGGD